MGWVRAKILLALILTGALSGQVLAADFEDTISGIQESGTTGGITQAEYDLLNSATENMIKRFQEGRNATSSGGDGRYSGILEMHDSNFDGLTDHGNAANALEGGTEEAAFGEKRLSSKDRQDRLNKIKADHVKNCKRRFTGEKNIAALGTCIASYVSPNVEDKGSAHGDEEEDHRVYAVSDKAFKQSALAGEAYAKGALSDAISTEAQYGNKNPNMRPRPTPGKKQNANIDLLKSEAAWLEEQKSRNVRTGWKYFRAQRFAGVAKGDISEEHELGEKVSSFYGKNESDTTASDQKMGQYLAKRSAILRQDICKDGKPPRDIDDKKGVCPNNEAPMSVRAYAEEKERVGDSGARKSAIATAEKNLKLSKYAQKDVDKNAEAYALCMKAGMWCTDKGPPTRNAQPVIAGTNVYEVKGDVGGAFNDTREFVYHQSERASQGPLNRYMDTVTNMDFNNKNASRKDYVDLQRQVQQAQTAAAEMQRLRPDQASQFNANTRSSNQMFGRNERRDGSVIVPGRRPANFISPLPTTQKYSAP